MKRIESVKLSGLNGERVDVVTFARWKKQIAGIEFSFALHLLPSFKVGLPNKLWISETGTGFNTLVVVKHPVSGQHMTDVMADKLGQSYVVRLAKSALHNQLKACGDSAFVDGLVRAEILLAKQQYQRETDHAAQVNCDVCEDTRMQAVPGEDGGLLAVACEQCKDSPVVAKESISHSRLNLAVRCDTCLDSRVVSTTDQDHEGQPIEAACPMCTAPTGGLKGGTFQVSGTLTETCRNQALLDKLASADFGKLESEYVPTQEEVDAALADAAVMNQNMAKYGTIDAPTLEQLWERRNYLQERTDQHSTMTGDTTEQEYEILSEELAYLDKQIHDLENPPCSK